jgi:hypothetical protein
MRIAAVPGIGKVDGFRKVGFQRRLQLPNLVGTQDFRTDAERIPEFSAERILGEGCIALIEIELAGNMKQAPGIDAEKRSVMDLLRLSGERFGSYSASLSN